MLVISDLTSLGSSVLGLSLQNATDSPGSDGGVLDIAEIRMQEKRKSKLSDHFLTITSKFKTLK